MPSPFMVVRIAPPTFRRRGGGVGGGGWEGGFYHFTMKQTSVGSSFDAG